MAIEKQKPLKQFLVKETDLTKSPEVKKAYESYRQKRDAFGNGLKELNLSIERLHDVMDKPLREGGAIVGEAWTLRQKDDDSLLIECWAQAKQKGKRKAEIETINFPFQGQ